MTIDLDPGVIHERCASKSRKLGANAKRVKISLGAPRGAALFST